MMRLDKPFAFVTGACPSRSPRVDADARGLAGLAYRRQPIVSRTDHQEPDGRPPGRDRVQTLSGAARPRFRASGAGSKRKLDSGGG